MVIQIVFRELQSSGARDLKIRDLLITCLTAWLRSGCISSAMIQNYGIAAIAFESLKNPEIFESAADLCCEIIIQSSFPPRDEQLVLSIYPYFKDLVILLKKNEHDDDVSRGLCRIFVQAGECYCDLIVKNLQMSASIFTERNAV